MVELGFDGRWGRGGGLNFYVLYDFLLRLIFQSNDALVKGAKRILENINFEALNYQNRKYLPLLIAIKVYDNLE